MIYAVQLGVSPEPCFRDITTDSPAIMSTPRGHWAEGKPEPVSISASVSGRGGSTPCDQAMRLKACSKPRFDPAL